MNSPKPKRLIKDEILEHWLLRTAGHSISLQMDFLIDEISILSEQVDSLRCEIATLKAALPVTECKNGQADSH